MILALALALASGILSHTDVNVVLVPEPAASTATVRAMIYSGSAEDPPGKEGLAWATAQVILERAGALPGLTVRVEKDVTIVSATVDGDGLDSFVEALAPVLIEPISSGTELGSVVSARQAADGPRAAEIAFDAILFAGHPYAHPPDGVPGSLRRLTGRDVADFHSARYRKGNLAIGVAGAVGAATAERIRSAFEPLADGEPPRDRRHPPYPTASRIFIIEDQSATRTFLRIGQPVNVTPGHPDHIDLLLAAACLDSLPGAASVRIGSDRFRRRLGALRVAIEVPPEAAGAALRDAMGGLDRALREGIPTECLASAAEALEESIRSRTQASGEALDLRLAEFLHGYAGHAERFEAAISAPNLETVRSALSRHLVPERLSVLAVVPDARVFIEQIRSRELPGWRPLREGDIEITSLERALRQRGF